MSEKVAEIGCKTRADGPVVEAETKIPECPIEFKERPIDDWRRVRARGGTLSLTVTAPRRVDRGGWLVHPIITIPKMALLREFSFQFRAMALLRRKTNLGELPPCQDRAPLNFRSRIDHSLLLEKHEKCAGRDLATGIGQQKTGARDLVILK